MRKKLTILSGLAIAVMSIFVNSYAASINEVTGQESNKMNIAVLELEGKNVPASDASILTDKLRGHLIGTGRFSVVERGQMDEVLKEQGFQQTGCTDQSCLIQMGQLIGVEGMMAGSVGKIGGMYLISLRLIGVEKGQIIKIVDEEVEGSIKDVLKYGIPNIARKMAGGDESSLKPSGKASSRSKASVSASRTSSGSGFKMWPFVASFCFGPRIGLEINEGKDIRAGEIIFGLPGLQFINGLAYGFPSNGMSGCFTSWCLGPRIGEQMHNRRIRSVEMLQLINLIMPPFGLIPRIMIAVEAGDGRTMQEIEEKEKLSKK